MKKTYTRLRSVGDLILELSRSGLVEKRSRELNLPFFAEHAILVALYTELRERGLYYSIEFIARVTGARYSSVKVASTVVEKLKLHTVQPVPEKVVETLAWLGVPEDKARLAVELFSKVREHVGGWVTPVLVACVYATGGFRQEDLAKAFDISEATVRKYVKTVKRFLRDKKDLVYQSSPQSSLSSSSSSNP